MYKILKCDINFQYHQTIIKLLYGLVNIIIKYFNTFFGFVLCAKPSLYTNLFCSLQIVNN